MDIRELLNQPLTNQEINEALQELIGYSCNDPDESERFLVRDEYGEVFDFRKHTGMHGIDTLAGILFLKEKIDESRGAINGKNETRSEIRKALGIY